MTEMLSALSQVDANGKEKPQSKNTKIEKLKKLKTNI